LERLQEKESKKEEGKGKRKYGCSSCSSSDAKGEADALLPVMRKQTQPPLRASETRERKEGKGGNALSLLGTLKLEALDDAEFEGVVDVLHHVPVERAGVLGVDGAGLDELLLEVVDVLGLGEEVADYGEGGR
jgi:hypothetical protein